MRYIKVFKYNEYSVFEVIEEYEKTIQCKLNNCENGYIVLGKNNVVKEADTIEELCDEAVAIYPDGSHDNCSVMHIVDNNGFCEAVYGCLSVSLEDLKKDYECWEVYGAIWTNKGLIYIAKMDNEGKLVLI